MHTLVCMCTLAHALCSPKDSRIELLSSPYCYDRNDGCYKPYAKELIYLRCPSVEGYIVRTICVTAWLLEIQMSGLFS